MVRKIIASLAFALCGLSATPAFASMIWKGTFENGTIDGWSKAEQVSPDRLQVVADPKGASRKVLKVRVHQGDDPINASGNRNELVYTGDLPQEEERWYRWQTLWPADYQSPDTWQLFTQFHHVTGGGSPPVEFFTNGNEMRLRISGKEVWSHPLEKDKWHDFVTHINWSSNANKGYVEVWYDGQQVLPKTYGATLFPGQSAYLKQGLYRKESINFDQTLYQSGAVIGTTMDDVWPANGSSGGSTLPALNDQQVSDFKSGSGCSTLSTVEWPLLVLAVGMVGLLLKRRRPVRVEVRRQ